MQYLPSYIRHNVPTYIQTIKQKNTLPALAQQNTVFCRLCSIFFYIGPLLLGFSRAKMKNITRHYVPSYEISKLGKLN